MTPADVMAALELPTSARVNQRVPKKMLAENGAPTAADKRSILDDIEEIQWLASLKPSNIGVPEFRDDIRTYLELAVLSLDLRPSARPVRLAELVHRAIPYPSLLLITTVNGLSVSLVHIRQAQNEGDKTVLDGDSILAQIPDDEMGQSFLRALPLVKQPRTDLFALYQGWLDSVTALEAAELTGHFSPNVSREQAQARHEALQKCRQLNARIAILRITASKEKQLARQVAANLEIKALMAERHQAANNL